MVTPPLDLDESETEAFIILAAGLSDYTLDIEDEWGPNYDEFSHARCASCDTTSGGPRRGCVATLFSR